MKAIFALLSAGLLMQTAPTLEPLETLRLEYPSERFTALAFSPNERLILSVDAGYQVKLWDIASGARIWTWTLTNTRAEELEIRTMRFANDSFE